MRNGLRQWVPVLVLFGMVALWTGCGKAQEDVDTTPFETAVTAYLKKNSMDLKVFEFKEIKVDGDKAEAKISLEYAGGMVGPKVRWTFQFAKDGDTWGVLSHKE